MNTENFSLYSVTETKNFLCSFLISSVSFKLSQTSCRAVRSHAICLCGLSIQWGWVSIFILRVIQMGGLL